MINCIPEFILLILLFGFISTIPKTRYMVGISQNKFIHFFYGMLNVNIEKNGSQITQVGFLAKNLSHRIK